MAGKSMNDFVKIEFFIEKAKLKKLMMFAEDGDASLLMRMMVNDFCDNMPDTPNELQN